MTDVYVTKYALTMGIVKTRLHPHQPVDNETYAIVHWPDAGRNGLHLRRDHLHETEQAAREMAEAMLIKEIQRLEKKLEKLRDFVFKVRDADD